MKPIEAYRHTAARARLLWRLHDGLVDIRKRRIRKDWSARFCRLMHWKQDSNIERVDSREAVVILREGSALIPEDFSDTAVAELLRSSLATSVSAMDRYVHERIVKGIVVAFSKPSLNRSQREFAIPAKLALQVAEALRRAHSEGRKVRPANEVRKKVQEILHKRSFQGWRDLEFGFELIGITGLNGRLQTAMGVADIGVIRDQLNTIVRRRNQIVHEGDLVRHERGGHARCQEISPAFVLASLDFMDTFVNALETVT